MIELPLSLVALQGFVLVVFRVGAILFAIPLFGGVQVPVMVRAGMALLLSLVLFPSVPGLASAGPNLTWMATAVLREVAIGFAVGFLVRLIFGAAEMAGQLVGFQMGFALVNVVDPVNSEQIPLLGQLQQLVALLVFLTINGHHMLLRALVESFQVVPLTDGHFSGAATELLVAATGRMFVIALQVGAPIIGALFVTYVTLGLVARAVPHMNVFIVSLPVTIGIGLLFLGLSVPSTARVVEGALAQLQRDVVALLHLLG